MSLTRGLGQAPWIVAGEHVSQILRMAVPPPGQPPDSVTPDELGGWDSWM